MLICRHKLLNFAHKKSIGVVELSMFYCRNNYGTVIDFRMREEKYNVSRGFC